MNAVESLNTVLTKRQYYHSHAQTDSVRSKPTRAIPQYDDHCYNNKTTAPHNQLDTGHEHLPVPIKSWQLLARIPGSSMGNLATATIPMIGPLQYTHQLQDFKTAANLRKPPGKLARW